jgi:hypothetical protein
MARNVQTLRVLRLSAWTGGIGGKWLKLILLLIVVFVVVLKVLASLLVVRSLQLYTALSPQFLEAPGIKYEEKRGVNERLITNDLS